jgi:glycerol-3-phosphate dehydrogenase
MQHISRTFDIDIPIADAIYKVLWEQLPAGEMFTSLEKTLS